MRLNDLAIGFRIEHCERFENEVFETYPRACLDCLGIETKQKKTIKERILQTYPWTRLDQIFGL